MRAGRECPRNPLTLCLITDRTRLLSRVAVPAGDWMPMLLEQIRGAVAGGVDVVQIRERGIDDRDYVTFLRRCVAMTRGTPTRVLVNDRPDLALIAECDGVHLREDGIEIQAVRHLAHKEFVVGRSIHDPSTAVRARTADYLIAGSVFETASKPGRQASLGLESLRAVVEAAGECPVWAIGGITAERMRDVAACGVRGVAAIGAFLPPAGAAGIATAVQKVTEALRFSLDSAAELS